MIWQYHGGTNFGRTAGGPFITTSYDYDAPIDEYGDHPVIKKHILVYRVPGIPCSETLKKPFSSAVTYF